MHNTLSRSTRLIIDQHIEHIRSLGHYKKIKSFLRSYGEDIDAEALYRYLHPDDLIDCAGMTFVSYSVGYRSCRKGCDCYVKNLSRKVALAKSQTTEEEKTAINQRRTDTVRKKYGADSVWQLQEIKDIASATKEKTYGSSTYNNRAQARKTTLEKYGVENVAQSQEVADRIVSTNLTRYGTEYGLANPEIQEKCRSTLLENYGVSTPMHSQEILHKVQSTVLGRYGVVNVSQSADVRNKISSNLRSSLYPRLVSTYKDIVKPGFTEDEYVSGVDSPWICVSCHATLNSPIINGNVPRCTVCFPYSISIFETQIREYVESIYSGNIEYNTRSVISPKELDIYIPEKKFAIECNGVYRHTELSGNKPKNYHLLKSTDCKKQGISLMHVTDYDWVNRNGIVKSMIANRLGLSTRIFARHCSVKKITDTSVIADFLINNHLQGTARSSHAYGLYYQGTLVSLMTFSRPRFDKSVEFELMRFCNLAGYTVVGGAGKLMSAFVKENSPKSLISYADISYGISNFYAKLGFTLIKVSSPGYSYYKNGILYNRMQFQKSMLSKKLEHFDSTLSEWENMKVNGYDRYWNCGNQVWKIDYENISLLQN